MTTIASDWNDIDAVVEYIRKLRDVQKVSLVAWSLGGPRAGGYAAQHPEKVQQLVLLAPAYNRDGCRRRRRRNAAAGRGVQHAVARASSSPTGIARSAAAISSIRRSRDAVWAEMLASDPVGATWGTGVRRAPPTTTWGWNQAMVGGSKTPTMMIAGAHDKQVPPDRVRAAYDDLGATDKVLVDLGLLVAQRDVGEEPPADVQRVARVADRRRARRTEVRRRSSGLLGHCREAGRAAVCPFAFVFRIPPCGRVVCRSKMSDHPRLEDPGATTSEVSGPADDGLFFELFDASPFPAVVTGWPTTSSSPSTSEPPLVFGIPQDQAVGALAPDYYVEPRRAAHAPSLSRARAGGRTCAFELKRPAGGTFWASASSRRVDLRRRARHPHRVQRHHRRSRSRAVTQRQRGAARVAEQRAHRRSPHSTSIRRQLRRAAARHPAASARTLKVGASALWRSAEDGRSIECVGLYRLDPPASTNPAPSSTRDEAPAYFAALERERVIAATDARTDPRTREFLRQLPAARAASARCSTCRSAPGRSVDRRALRRARRRAAHMDGGRAELRHLDRQSDRRRDGRGRAARRRWRGWPTARPGPG